MNYSAENIDIEGIQIKSLLDRYLNSLLGVAYFILQDKELALQTVKDVITSVIRKYNQPNKEVVNLGYLINKTRKKSLAVLTKEDTKVLERVAFIENVLPFMHKHNPEPEGITDNQKEELKNRIPQDQYKLLYLMLFYGFNKEETVKYTKIPSGAIKTRLRKVLLDINKIINPN